MQAATYWYVGPNSVETRRAYLDTWACSLV